MVILLLPSLNYDEKDPKFQLLGKIFDFMNKKRTLDYLSRAGIKNRSKVLLSIKILFMSMFFEYPISKVINELNRSNRLRKFVGVEVDNLKVDQIYEILSRSTAEQYVKFINGILNLFNKDTRGKYRTFIVDATPSACDFNLDKKYITKEHLEKLKLKWSYSTTKGTYIGFKVTLVLNKKTMCPVSVLIHNGAPHDSRIFEEVLKELKRRKIIRPKDILLFDRGYFSYKNYSIALNKYKIIPVIFPKDNFTIDRLKSFLSLPLEACAESKRGRELKTLIIGLGTILFKKLENWEELKPKRGIIEDFFKLAKDAFGLGEFHSYSAESMMRNIYLCLLLTALIVQQRYKTKTRLQRLSEGDVLQNTPVKEKNKNKKDNDNDVEKTEEKPSNKNKKGQQELDIIFNHNQSVLDSF